MQNIFLESLSLWLYLCEDIRAHFNSSQAHYVCVSERNHEDDDILRRFTRYVVTRDLSHSCLNMNDLACRRKHF